METPFATALLKPLILNTAHIPDASRPGCASDNLKLLWVGVLSRGRRCAQNQQGEFGTKRAAPHNVQLLHSQRIYSADCSTVQCTCTSHIACGEDSVCRNTLCVGRMPCHHRQVGTVVVSSALHHPPASLSTPHLVT